MKYKVCEFYSGIGGYHLALSSLLPSHSYEVVAAFEISGNANAAYSHNFPKTPVFETNLCGLTATKLGKIMKCDNNEETVFVMSPPCQPFTRQGARKDDQDARSDSVLHLFSIFPELPSLPNYFVIENVQGFENSNTRGKILEFFKEHGYKVEEFLLNSNQFGIPNSRLRYYLVAKRLETGSPSEVPGTILGSLPGYTTPSPTPPPLSQFLDTSSQEECQLGEKFLTKWGKLLDIVTPSDNGSCCFTKGYTVKAEGSGSVLQQNPSTNLSRPQPMADNCNSLSGCELSGPEFEAHMRSLNLRFFSPSEIARLHGYPDWFSFPEPLTLKQRYKLLGNGLNVAVVKRVLEYLLSGESGP
eukprot:sb/3466091/